MKTVIQLIGILGLAVLGAGAAVAAAPAPRVLARRGAAADYVIVRPQKASESQVYAAEELQRYVTRMTGVTLPIETRRETLPEKAIVIGGDAVDAALGEDGFRLKAEGARIRVQGSPVRGCLYGVYELLERFGGCRWYASWHTVVPSRTTFEVPGDLDVTQRPDFVMRSAWWFDVIRHTAFAAHLRLNTQPWGEMKAKFGGDVFRFCDQLPSCHTFDTLLPPSEYRKDHPDYFSRVKGDRVQPCLTHPDVLAIVTSNVLAHVRRDPGAKVYGVSQNDWLNFCTCPECARVDEEEGSHAGTMVRFVNAVADAVAREAPGKLVETLAYQYTRRPPAKTRLRPNVVPCLCSIECDFAYSLPESSFEQNKSFLRDIEGWSQMTDQLYIWDYVTNFRHYPYPFPNVYALQGNLQFFRANKAKEMFLEGAFQGYLADFAELKAWLQAKWMWNADRPMKELLDDFFAGHYGKAAPFVRTYFEELHALRRADRTSPLRIYERVDAPALPDAFLARADALFEQARAAVRDEPAVYGKAVRATAFAVDYTRFLRFEGRGAYLLWFRKDVPTAADWQANIARARRMLEVMEEFKPARMSEDPSRNAAELELIRTAAAREARDWTPQPRITCGVVEEKDLNFCRSAKMGTFVDDPLAEDGRALKLFNTHFEWSTDFRLRKIATDPGQKLHLRVRCRVARRPNATGEAFWMGVYDYGRCADMLSLSVPAAQVAGDDYAWYDVGTFTPSDLQSFWIGPGRFKKGGRSCIDALFVDKIELRVVETP